MALLQTLSDFASNAVPFELMDDGRGGGHFVAYTLEDFCVESAETAAVYARKDFYKILLTTADATFHCGGHSRRLNPDVPALVFTNRETPYRWEIHGGTAQGLGCVFTDDFLPLHTHVRPGSWAVFDPEGPSFFELTPEQAESFAAIFRKMIAEQRSAYAHRHELLFLYVLECVHGALKLAPDSRPGAENAAKRLTEAFRALLAGQFPVTTPAQRLELRTPQAFADRLAVHVNTLNRALKETTGKTTTGLIAERVTQEARALLRHTDWPVGMIGDCLGFDEPTHFTHFFRKHAGLTPSQMREV